MTEIIDLLMNLRRDVRYMRNYINLLRKPEIEVLKNAWMDNQEVMQTLHISPRTLQNFRKDGTLPHSKLRGKFYYRRQDVEYLLEKNYYNPNFRCRDSK